MGNTDSIPVVSQTKSLVQFICKDKVGARETQINFTKGCPIVSQLRSLIEYKTGDEKAALDTQLVFIDGVDKFTDAIPLIGHAKGVVYYTVVKDKEAGDRAMKSSSRTVGVLGGAAVGAITAGPVGAFTGGVVAGIAMDGIITEADSKVHKEFRPHGYVAAMNSIQNNEAESKSGTLFDIAVGLASDGVIGLSAASGVGLAERPMVMYATRAAIDRKHATNGVSANDNVDSQHPMDANYLSEEESKRFVFIHTTDGALEVQLPADRDVEGDLDAEDDAYFAALRHFPDVFFCPITTELMTDPMVCADGHTYERHAIEGWLAAKHTSPMTNLPLPSLDLVPNHALRGLIAKYSEARGMDGMPSYQSHVPRATGMRK